MEAVDRVVNRVDRTNAVNGTNCVKVTNGATQEAYGVSLFYSLNVSAYYVLYRLLTCCVCFTLSNLGVH